MNNEFQGSDWGVWFDVLGRPRLREIGKQIHVETQKSPPKLSLEDIHTLQLQAVETNDKEWFDQLSELKATTV